MVKVFGWFDQKLRWKYSCRSKPLDCHRKELIGNESAKAILCYWFKHKQFINELEKNYLIEKPSIGISFDLPLDILEITDFWLDIYKNQEAWETYWSS